MFDRDLFEMLVFANRLSLVVYLVGGLFVSRFYTEGGWMFLMLPVCIDRAVENQIRAEATQDLILRSRLEQTGLLWPAACPTT